MGLISIATQVKTCRLCSLRAKCRLPVPGIGTRATIMLVGTAPTWEDDRSGVAWSSQAGQFLSVALDVLEIRGVYMTTLVKCYPGRGVSEPPPSAIKACQAHLQAEYDAIHPELIVAMGAPVMRFFGIKGGIIINAGRVFDTSWGPVLVLRHPSGILRRSADAPAFFTQFNAIISALNPIVPPQRYGDENE